MKRIWTVLVLAAAVIGASASAMVAVEETEYAIISRLGKPVRIREEAGLAWKLPWPVESVHRVDRRVQVFDPVRDVASDDEKLTQDKKNLLVSCFCVWRVRDPLRFAVSVRDRERAEQRLDDVIRSELGAVVNRHPLSDFLSVAVGEDGAAAPDEAVAGSGGAGSGSAEAGPGSKLASIAADLTREVAAETEEAFGIEVIAVRIKRMNFPDQNRSSVFQRMREERGRISSEIRERGLTEGKKIKSEAEIERARILAEATIEAERKRGEADAEATRIFAAAYEQDPALFKFLRGLEVIETIGPDDMLYLNEDSDLRTLLDLVGEAADDGPDPEGTGQ